MKGPAWRFVQLLIFALIAFTANFEYGFSTTYVNTPVQQFKIYINESLVHRGQVMTDGKYNTIWNLFLNIWFVGFFLGIWLSPILNDRYGRRVGFLVGNLFAFIASVLQCAAIYWLIPELLIASRFLTSVCMAVTYQSCILYLQECSPTALRGFMSFLSEISFAVMTMVGTLLGTNSILGTHLFWLTAFAVPFCLFFLLALYILPETPKFLLIAKKDDSAALRSVVFYHGEDVDAKQVLATIQLEAECEEDQEGGSTLKTVKEIFVEPHLRKALLLSCAALQNTVALWAILLSSTFFLEDANVEDAIAQWSSTAMTLAYVVGTLSGAAMIEKLGRRPLLLTFTFANNFSLLAFVLFSQLQPVIDSFKYGCLVSLILYGYTYGTGVGPISWFISSELVPQRHRSVTQSLAYAINTVMVVISTFTVLPLYSVLGSYSFLLLYSLPSAFCLVYLFRCLPETKGKEIYDIVNELRTK